MLEIGDSMFMCISALVGIALYLITVFSWRMPTILKMIAEFQEIIEKGEQKRKKWNFPSIQLLKYFIESNDSVATANYRKLNARIEWASEWYYFLLVKLSSLGCMIPPLFLTIVNYIIFDMGDESYFLPLPMV